MTRHALAIITALTGLTLPAPAHAGGASFDRIADAFDPQPCGGNGCFTNHLRVTDIDGDGDLDVVMANYADFFGGGNAPEPLLVYTNDGSGNLTDDSANAVGNYAGNLRQIAIGDVDGDGSPDIYGSQGNGDAHVLFINDGSGAFADEADARLPADYPAGAAARMGDVDNDGDLDIFAADAYASSGPPFGRLYINDGMGVFTEAMAAIPDSISGIDIDDVEFLDVDRDFDLDLVVNAHANGIGALWLNDGEGVFTAGGSLAPPATMNFHYNMAPCDVDGDGDLDLWVDNIGGGFTEQLQINDGAGNFTDETAARVTGNPAADDNGVICADIDNDGDFDGVVLSLSSTERFLVNDGSGNFTFVQGMFPQPDDNTLWGEFGDLDGDGRFDLVTAQGEGNPPDTHNQVYIANDLLPEDSIAPVIIDVEDPGMVPAGVEAIVRFAVSDRTVTDEGPRLDRAFAVVDPDGDATPVDAWFMGGDVFRVALPGADEGPVEFQVCAEDRNANLGCSETQTYDIGGEPPGETGDESTGGGGVDDTIGGSDPTETMSATGNGSNAGSDGTGSGSTETETETAGAGDDGGSGCSCTQDPNGSGFGWMALGLLGLGALRRRRD
ncbi:MAG: VCBS repeat-containing protein [Myxococcota bacterium]